MMIPSHRRPTVRKALERLETRKKHFKSMHDFRVAQSRATLMNELHRVHGTMYGRLRPGQREFATFEQQKQKILRGIAESMFDDSERERASHAGTEGWSEEGP